ncbi:hypothetical protein QVD17_18759 [Tagetes erecta]|uniref:Uncharacterized protein n=1 Tax=Tagetes erecta TaxID=13708 RepID=A0AAD8KL99_TARER|nr:hypothetical protein QVD17_18759 [Tagetes erecta]
MASAILHTRNDSRSTDFITNFTENGNVNFARLQHFTNPNPNFTNREIIRKSHQQVPYFTSPEPAFVSSSINSAPTNAPVNTSPNGYGYRYITFRLDSYTRRELKSLKKRLMSDLEGVRLIKQFVCSPQLELPKVPEVYSTVNERKKSGIGMRCTKHLAPVRDTKKQCGGRVTNAQKRKMMMRECTKVLGKLMKHKHGWVFNTPVDAAALKLYDYHNVVHNPMDLGTVKSKLGKNEYESPLAFASDVRLTFQNAMLYNGKGSDVFVMAEWLLLLFEDMFNSTHSKLAVNQRKKQNCSPSVPKSVEKPTVALEMEVSLVPEAKMMIRVAKKPEMTAEEKAELAASFCNLELGPEGMNQIMAIVKKGEGLEHEGDEIELDLGVLDNETLWELHSFIGDTLRNNAATTCNMNGVVVDNSAGCDNVVDEQGRKRDDGEEDVDIGDEMQLTNLPSVEIEKDVVNGSSSSSDSSSQSDSSSSDSGSGNCSRSSYNEQEVN